MTDGFGERLQQAMRIRRVGQGQLAAKSGISQSYISRLLSGERAPTLNYLLALADALDVSADWLLVRDRECPQELTPEEDELLKRFRAVTDKGARARILDVVSSVAEAFRTAL